jgi:hypothetical protein
VRVEVDVPELIRTRSVKVGRRVFNVAVTAGTIEALLAGQPVEQFIGDADRPKTVVLAPRPHTEDDDVSRAIEIHDLAAFLADPRLPFTRTRVKLDDRQIADLTEVGVACAEIAVGGKKQVLYLQVVGAAASPGDGGAVAVSSQPQSATKRENGGGGSRPDTSGGGSKGGPRRPRPPAGAAEVRPNPLIQRPSGSRSARG